MENIFLILGALIVIVFIWIFWLRNSLIKDLSSVLQIKSIVTNDFLKRRDTIPYLLESYKSEKEPNDFWRKLLDLRARLDSSENEIQETLQKFFSESEGIKNLNFLEAKKDILDLNKNIEASKKEMNEKIQVYLELRKRFPYSLASAIFSLPELSPL